MAVSYFIQLNATELNHLRYHPFDHPGQRATFRKNNVMARLTSIPPFLGTRDHITTYLLRGKYHMRSRSSLTGERVKTDPAFQKTMQNAAVMAKASPIASKVYALVPLQHKSRELSRKLTGEVMTWLKYGWDETDIIEWLVQQYTGKRLPKKAPVTVLRPSYRRSKPVVGHPAPGLFKNAPFTESSFGLRAWRRRDKEYKRALYEERMRPYEYKDRA